MHSASKHFRVSYTHTHTQTDTGEEYLQLLLDRKYIERDTHTQLEDIQRLHSYRHLYIFKNVDLNQPTQPT